MDDITLSTIKTTSKDFNTIYPELIDLVKTLTNKWDPELSNESDPGVLLIKELAVMGDKLNYNIDKNILECFPLSVTQESNARKLYDELGYNMHWYKSGQGNVKFRLKSSLEDLHLDTYYLPQFTALKDSTGEIVYTTLYRTPITSNTEWSDIECIEGTINDFKINDSEKITLSNLDEDLRLYFSEPMIAENGIFIADNADYSNWLDENGWKRVDNLVSYPAGKKVFELNISPITNLPYIQFPEDVASLITNYIKIKYVVSQGQNGNIKANILSAFKEQLSITDNTDTTISMAENIIIKQDVAIINGKNPETINEAYTNYKKTVGVFNTLVTRRDYNNYIYENASPDIISNIIVADRTNDINATNYIQTWAMGTTSKELLVKEDESDEYFKKNGSTYEPVHLPAMDAFTVNLYMTDSVKSIYDKNTYNQTYSPINVETGALKLLEIENLLEDVKSAQHDFYLPENNDDLFNIHINYNIKGLLTTYNKVTPNEAEEIQKNVLNTLRNLYNCSTLEYGSELDYDTLIDHIIKSDARIKTFALNSLHYTISPMACNGEEIKTDENITSYNQELIARMVLAGNVQLLRLDDLFIRDFGQESYSANTDPSPIIKSITTTANISVPKIDGESSDTGYELQQNENIRLFSPNLLITQTFNVGCKITMTGGATIPANTDTCLTTGQSITITNISGQTDPIIIESGSIVNCSHKLDANIQYTLLSGEVLTKKEISTTTLIDNTPYYFITNSIIEENGKEKYQLKLPANAPYILQENEYFIYSGINDTTELIILGSGTAIQLEDGKTLTCTKSEIKDNDYSQVSWEYINPNTRLKITEMQIINLGEGTEVGYEIDSLSLNNIPQLLDNTFYYRDVNTTTPQKYKPITPIENYPSSKWYAQSKLRLNSYPTQPQKLLNNQQIKITPIDSSDITIDGTSNGVYVQFNYATIMDGGENINARVLIDNEFDYALQLYAYKDLFILTNDITIMPNKDYYIRSGSIGNYIYTKVNNPVASDLSAYYEKVKFNRNKSGYIELDKDNIGNVLPFTFTQVDNIYSAWVLPIYAQIESNAQIEVKADDNTILGLFNCKSVETTPTKITKSKESYIYYLPTGAAYNNIKFSSNVALGDNDKIYVGYPTKFNGLNGEEIDTDTFKITDNIIGVVDNISGTNGIDKENKFNWVYRVPSSDKVLTPTDPVSYWDINHIYNHYSIPKINFDNINIKVNSSSIK